VARIDLGFELDSAVISGQAALVQELLSNLIHNSIEHAGGGAKITVKTYVLGDTPILEVEDDGIGIGEEERDKVLQRFFRGRLAKGNGSGLGLAIVDEIARIHNARVVLSTPVKWQGLVVRIVFKNASTIGTITNTIKY